MRYFREFLICTLVFVQWSYTQDQVVSETTESSKLSKFSSFDPLMKNPQVPGTVINHKPKSSGISLGSPSIVILPNGDYVVSHSYSSIKRRDKGDVHRTAVFKSTDRGASWTFLTEMDNQRWANLFYHQKALYMLGVDRAFGNMAIRKSTDNGNTWTTPRDSTSGLLAKGRYHCAPVPMVIHKGRIWRAMEDALEGRNFRAFMMSAPLDSDLMRAESWTMTNKVGYQKDWHPGGLNSWLEGNAVISPNGKIVNVLRCEFGDTTHNMGAMMQVSEDGKRTSFDPDTGFILLPGATGKKFTIRKDTLSDTYWSLVNWIQPKDVPKIKEVKRPGKIRNTLVLVSSNDLRTWTIERMVLHHPDILDHAFQYVDWEFDGEDIIAVSRTSFDDDYEGAANYHDANFITFHRVTNFRGHTE